MYLGGVNRGISFTRAGFYTTGLVFILGFFATASGYNGLFLSLGFGLSFLVISGMLSEKTIKAVEMQGLADTTAEAGLPFSIDFRIRNVSPSWYFFTLESLVSTELPKFRFLKPTIDSLIEARLLILPPGQTVTVTGKGKAMPRGFYHDFYIVERTLFPFGLISKFKVGQITANLSILPPLDNEFDADLNHELRSRVANQADEPQFHSHRPVTPGSPLHSLDMKKNAGRPRDQWVMKLFESPASDFGFLIDPDWAELMGVSTDAHYERFLSRLRTAGDSFQRTRRPLILRTYDGNYVVGYDAIISLLTRAPHFPGRAAIVRQVSSEKPKPGAYFRLKIGLGAATWERDAVRIAA